MKYKFIIVRGVRIKVKASDAQKWEKEEKKLIQNEWSTNKVD